MDEFTEELRKRAAGSLENKTNASLYNPSELLGKRLFTMAGTNMGIVEGYNAREDSIKLTDGGTILNFRVVSYLYQAKEVIGGSN